MFQLVNADFLKDEGTTFTRKISAKRKLWGHSRKKWREKTMWGSSPFVGKGGQKPQKKHSNQEAGGTIERVNKDRQSSQKVSSKRKRWVPSRNSKIIGKDQRLV